MTVGLLMGLVAIVALAMAWYASSLPRVLVVDMGPGRAIAIGGRPASLGELKGLLKETRVDEAIVRCTPDVSYDAVMSVLATIEIAGVRNVRLSDLPPATSAAKPSNP